MEATHARSNRRCRPRCGAIASSIVTPLTAGTTGGLRGRVLDVATQTPLAGAVVTSHVALAEAHAQKPTSTERSTSSRSHLTRTRSRSNFKATNRAITNGVNVQADQVQNLGAIPLRKVIQTIGGARARSSSDVMRPGTTSDVYSVNAAGQGRGDERRTRIELNQAYSAIATVPGANLPQGQQGWNQLVYIRGGDYSDVANELDGIPVQRASDFAPVTTLSSLGQQEVQTYTGGTPASAEASGLSGYINQVIKTGSYPGYAQHRSRASAVPRSITNCRLRTQRRHGQPQLHVLSGLLGRQSGLPLLGPVQRRSAPADYSSPRSAFRRTTAASTTAADRRSWRPGSRLRDRRNARSRDIIISTGRSLGTRTGTCKDDVQFLYVTSEVWARSTVRSTIWAAQLRFERARVHADLRRPKRLQRSALRTAERRVPRAGVPAVLPPHAFAAREPSVQLT